MWVTSFLLSLSALPSSNTWARLIVMPLGAVTRTRIDFGFTQRFAAARPNAVAICCGVAPVSGGCGVGVGSGVGVAVGVGVAETVGCGVGVGLAVSVGDGDGDG